MGHKAIVVFDIDHLNDLSRDPAAFVDALRLQVLAHRRTGGDVRLGGPRGGTSVAQVVWSGHANETPALEFKDFDAQPLSLETARARVDEHNRQVAYDSLN